MIEYIGSTLAISGAACSIIGNIRNTVYLDHYMALGLWTVSAPLMSIWAFGYLVGWWNGGLSIAAILGMNLVFTVSNVYGLWKYRGFADV